MRFYSLAEAELCCSLRRHHVNTYHVPCADIKGRGSGKLSAQGSSTTDKWDEPSTGPATKQSYELITWELAYASGRIEAAVRKL